MHTNYKILPEMVRDFTDLPDMPDTPDMPDVPDSPGAAPNNPGGTPNMPVNPFQSGPPQGTPIHLTPQQTMKLMQALAGQVPDDEDDEDDSVKNMLIDYTEEYKDGTPAMFREAVVADMISVLIGMDKPNVLLSGPAGCGKTKIVENLGTMIANGQVPDNLKKAKLYELSLTSLMSGTSLRGDLEKKTKKLIDFLEKNDTILFIDEIHRLFGSQEFNNVAQSLKTSLARGKIRVIGATTLQEATELYQDPAFCRRFEHVVVDELTAEQTEIILQKIQMPRLLKHHSGHFSIDPSLLSIVVQTADRYNGIGKHRPDNAMTLLDRTVSSKITARHTRELALENKIRLMRDAGCSEDDIEDEKATLLVMQGNPVVNITRKDIQQTAFRLAKGNHHVQNMTVKNIRDAVSGIKGQDNVIEELAKQLCMHDSDLFPSQKPLSIVLSGPAGCGKTELVKCLSEKIVGKQPITLNMTEYTDETSLNNIIGSVVGYIGSDSKAELPFDELESNPYQVILLDEFDAAHISVQRRLLSVLDKGILKTNRGQILDFSKAIIFMTVNQQTIKKSNSIGFAVSQTEEQPSLQKPSLDRIFDEQTLSRFDAVFALNPINKATYRLILEDIYRREYERLQTNIRRIRIPETIAETEMEQMLNRFNPDYGAHNAEKEIQKYITYEASRSMFDNET